MATHSIQQQLQQQFSQASVGDRFTWQFELDQSHAICTLSSTDKLACAADSIVWSVKPREPARRAATFDAAKLRKRADELSQKLTYLLEPIQVHEWDEPSGLIQMRSDPPARDTQQPAVRYYELMAGMDRLSLVRYEKLAGSGRQQISMLLTHEVLARVLADVDAVWSA